MGVMVIELDRTYYREVQPPLTLLWLALALAIGCFGALVALALGPLVGLAPAALALGMTLGFLALEVMQRWNDYD